MKVTWFIVFLQKSPIWEKSRSWDMGQNALVLANQFAGFLNQLYLQNKMMNKFMEIKSWLKKIGVGVVKNGSGHSGQRTLKLAVSQEGNNGINWFLVCWYKNGRGLLGHGTLKSAVSQEWIDEISWFFASWYNFRKAKR